MTPELESSLSNLSKIRMKPMLVMVLPYIYKGIPLKVSEILRGKSFQELDVVLFTPGGDPDAAYLLATMLKRHAKVVNIIVPLYAKSAGTLLSLCADSILMTDLSELGPLDTQVTEIKEKGNKKTSSALNESKALEQVQTHCLEALFNATDLIILKSKNTLSYAEAVELATELTAKTAAKLYDKIDPMRVGQSARDLAIAQEYARRILCNLRGMQADEASSMANTLVNGYPSHEYVLDIKELSDIGLPASVVTEDEDKVLIDIRRQLLKTDNEIIELMLEYNRGDNDGKNSTQETKKDGTKEDKPVSTWRESRATEKNPVVGHK